MSDKIMVEITHQEIVDHASCEQDLLCLLKDKGAPITGECFLRVDDNYSFFAYEAVPHQNKIIYEFNKKGSKI
jgi:hypothetical protein